MRLKGSYWKKRSRKTPKRQHLRRNLNEENEHYRQ